MKKVYEPVQAAKNALAKAETEKKAADAVLKDAEKKAAETGNALKRAEARLTKANRKRAKANALKLDDVLDQKIDSESEFTGLNDYGKTYADAVQAEKSAHEALAAAKKKADEKAAAAEEAANAYTLALAEQVMAEENFTKLKPVYKFIAGEGTTYTQDTGGNFVIATNGRYGWFDDIYIDGKKVDRSNYTSAEGSTYVTLTKAFMDTLAAGEHTVGFVYDYDIVASGSFTIAKTQTDAGMKAAEEVSKTEDTVVSTASEADNVVASISSAVPTGDDSNVGVLYAMMFAAGTAAAVLEEKRRKTLS